MRKIKLLLPLLALFICVSAKAIVAAGDCGKDGKNVTWNLDDNGTLTFYGSGEMEDYENAVVTPWADYVGEIKNVRINEGITRIGNYAFGLCYNATSVTIPESMIEIGDYAFGFCVNITSVTIPNLVKKIGEGAFLGCI